MYAKTSAFLLPLSEVSTGAVSLKELLEDTARYAGLLLAPAEGFGLRLIMLFGQFYAIFGVQ